MSIGGKEFALHRGRRGFTLVELAVALAVVGLLLGLSLIPLRMLEERRQIREEMHRLEVVRDAIVGYALRHRTRARTILFVAYDTPVIPHPHFNNIVSLILVSPPMAFRLPGGRPYLPCPDVDGDGYEDRIPVGPSGFTQGIEVKPDLTVTATLFMGEGLDSPSGPHWNFPYGSCLQSRGSAPWRTLGVDPSDGWGNRHTYFADPVFASALLGFDGQSIADIYDSRAPRAAGLGPSPRRAVDIPANAIGNSTFLFAPDQGNDCPSVICDGGRAGRCARECGGQAGRCAQEPVDHPAWRCLWRAAPDDLVLKAGAMTKREIFPESPRGKRFPPGGVTDGLPFVLASHGPNGRFAVNHWATLLNPVNEFGSASPICNNYAWATHRSNFDSDAVVDPGDRALIHEAANGSRLSPDPARCAQVKELMDIYHLRDEFNRAFFVWEPPGTSDKSGFDDLLLWMTREELSLAISGDIPRLPQMIVPYFP